MRRDRYGSWIGGIKSFVARPSRRLRFCGNITEWRKPLENVSWRSARNIQTCLLMCNLVFRFCNIAGLKSFIYVLRCKTLVMFWFNGSML